jgi:hypothetical protein
MQSNGENLLQSSHQFVMSQIDLGSYLLLLGGAFLLLMV